METQYSVNSLIAELTKSKHGSLNEYAPEVERAASHDPEFLAHLVPWNLLKGEIRDSKVAIPVLSLRHLEGKELSESSVAALMTLDPRNLAKAIRFSKELTKTGKVVKTGNGRILEDGLRRYLEAQEQNRKRWNKTAVQHRASLKELYAVSHTVPSGFAQSILFDKKYPKGSVFEVISELRKMTPVEAAGNILKHEIPFQIALGALGLEKKEYLVNTEYPLAFINQMSGQQLLNSTKFLTTLGVFENPMLKAEYQSAITKAASDKKVSTLKAGKVIEAVKDLDEHVVAKLTQLQEKKLVEGGVEGDWLVLGDMSGSMESAMNIASEIAGVLAKSVKGKVYLVFFNYQPRMFDVSGKTLEDIKKMTKNISAHGTTSCGCGIDFLASKNIIVNGIAIVSDGGDNLNPYFHEAYPKYANQIGFEPVVYFFRVPGDRDFLSRGCTSAGIVIEKFEITSQTDYYSIPNIVKTMKTKRYMLYDEIMSTPLLTFDTVFAKVK